MTHETMTLQKKFDIEIIKVIDDMKSQDKLPHTETGTLINSDEFNNLHCDDAKEKITKLSIEKSLVRKL